MEKIAKLILIFIGLLMIGYIYDHYHINNILLLASLGIMIVCMIVFSLYILTSKNVK